MCGRLLDVLRRGWRILTRPSVYFSLGFLTVGGFVAGVIFWGAFNTALELTNTETFCISCHEMHDNVFQELKQTIHYTNRSGVRATCPDCHVPHEWTHKIARKMQASQGGLGQDLRHDQHAGEVRGHAPRAGRARVDAAEGQRLPGMPQLPQLPIHGLHPPERPRGRRCTARSWPRASAPASTATRASPTGCPTWPACRAGMCRCRTERRS